MTKPNQIIGYIITTEYWHEPLELVAGPPYPWPVLLRGDNWNGRGGSRARTRN